MAIFFIFKKSKKLESEEKPGNTSMEEENVVRLDLDEPDFFYCFEIFKKLEYEENMGIHMEE